MRNSERRSFSWPKQVLFAAIIAGGFLLLSESAVRVWAWYFRTTYERYNAATGRLELVPNFRAVRPGGLEMRINSRGFLGPEFDEEPASGVYRIIAVGDSCTFADGFPHLAYPGLLEQQLNSAAGGRRFEVINAGIEGYNSTFARQRIEQELLGYRPRLVVIYVGWNDLMKVDPRNAAATGRYAALSEVLEASYLVRAYRKLLFFHLRPLLFKPRVTDDEDSLKMYEAFVPRTYEENLKAIALALERSGVQGVFVTLPTVVRAGMTSEDLAREHVVFPYFAGTYSVGEFLSLHGAYNMVIRRVAAAHSIPVVDLDASFNRHDKRGLFWDTMHPSRKGHCLISRELFIRIRGSLGLQDSGSPHDAQICR